MVQGRSRRNCIWAEFDEDAAMSQTRRGDICIHLEGYIHHNYMKLSGVSD